MKEKETVAAESNKETLVSELINNPQTRFTTADESWLKKQSPEILQKLIPVKKTKKRYSRITSVCDTLKEQPQTIDEWTKNADKKFAANGGQSKLNASKDYVNIVSNVLAHFPIDYTIPTK